jgi:hypothetical protein
VPLQAVLLPLFVEVALTLGLLFWLGPHRVGAIRQGRVKPENVALGQKVWPERVVQIGNAFDNQFQLPVLFYVVTILAISAHKADVVFVVLAWLFVLSRIVHAVILTGSNIMLPRFLAYLAGAAALTVMWVVFAIEVLLGL